MDTTWPKISPSESALILIDAQEKLFHKIHKEKELEKEIIRVIKALGILDIPMIITEQYPEGLGSIITPLKLLLPDEERYSKTTFSCLGESTIAEKVQELNKRTWILIGVESHVCVLQTAKDLINLGKRVVVVFEAVGSRKPHLKEQAIEEMRRHKIEVVPCESLLFELLGDAKHPKFKEISKLIIK